MRGLKTQESQKFNNFWNIVQDEAKTKLSIFFLECGEGRDFETPSMEGEDLCGWLIPLNKVADFEPEWQRDNVSDDWSEYITWAEWEETNGTVIVQFKIH